jgi:hypothetical protein
MITRKVQWHKEVYGLTYEQAKEALTKIRSFYNKILDSEQESVWFSALQKLQIEPCTEAMKDLMMGRAHQTYMPTVPEFITLYNKYKPSEHRVENKNLCLICMNKGIVMMEMVKEYSERQKLKYEYSLHCICEKGKAQAVDYTNKAGERYYTEPVTNYFDINELKANNKRKLEKKKEISDGQKQKIKWKTKYCLKSV